MSSVRQMGVLCAAAAWLGAVQAGAAEPRAGQAAPAVAAAGQQPEIRQVRFALIPPEPVPLPPVEGPVRGAPLTLDQVEHAALAFHPALREAEGLVRAARGQWLQAGLLPNPAVGYFGEEIGDDGTAGKQGGFVSQEVVTAGKLRLGRAVARREIAAAEQQFSRTRLQLLTTVRSYYFEAVAAQREVALARQLAAMGKQAVRAAELLFKAMEGSRASLLQSQVEYETSSLLVEQATNRHEAAWRRLESISGLPPGEPRWLDDALAEPLPEIDWEPTRDRLLRESPELAELRARVERARWAVQQASAGRYPNVNLQSGVQFDYATDNTIAAVQVSVPLPIFDRNQGNVARACGELAAAQAALEERELALAQRLADAVRDYRTAQVRVARFAEKILPAAQESLDLVSRAYEQGEIDYLQLLTAQRTYIQNSLTNLENLQVAWKRWAVIDGMLVGRLPDEVR